MKRWFLLTLFLITVLVTVGCGGSPSTTLPTTPAGIPKELTKVILMLDWVPNTNHTGIFVAQEKGYFKEAGLDVTINQPGEVSSQSAVGSGVADFGISMQENVTLARAADIPVVSIAAIIQHNTSGFASLTSKNVKSPKDWEGLNYGTWASKFEPPTLESMMKSAGGDYSKLKMVNIGSTDPLALLAEGKIDLVWIFYGWQGFQAKQQGVDISVVMMEDYFNAVPDYYTPVVIASESTIATKPELVRAFLKAVSRGYEFAIEKPGEAADILLSAVPELDKELVKASQEWLSKEYRADAPRWGEQKESVWKDYIDWMSEYSILAIPVVPAEAFTNEFLP